jgi:hypothetical protein
MEEAMEEEIKFRPKDLEGVSVVAPRVMPHATRDNHEDIHCEDEEAKDDYDFDFEEDSVSKVQELFPDWQELFRKRPFLQLRRLGDGTFVILLGYGRERVT